MNLAAATSKSLLRFQWHTPHNAKPALLRNPERTALIERLWEEWASHRWNKTAFLVFVESLPLELMQDLITPLCERIPHGLPLKKSPAPSSW